MTWLESLGRLRTARDLMSAGQFGAAFGLGLVCLVVAALLSLANPTAAIGNFVHAVLIAVFVLAGTAAVLPWDGVRRAVFALTDRMGLSVETTIDVEVRRVNLLRILLGLIYTGRQLLTTSLFLFIAHHDPHPLQVYLCLGLSIAAGVMLTFGLFTPIAVIALSIGALWTIDLGLYTATLGTMVFQMALLVLLLLPAGTSLSIDARLLRRGGVAGRAVATVYSLIGRPTEFGARAGKLMAVAAYGALGLYSVLIHARDPAWLSGYANAQILTSFYLSRYAETFQAIYQAAPVTFIGFSIVTQYIMSAWELLFLPCLFFGPTRRFAIYWGVLFFTVSLLVLQLSYLAYVEFILWPLLFWRRRWLDGRGRIRIFFDDRCRLCDHTMRTLAALDLFGIIEPAGLSKSRELLRQAGIDEKDATTDLVGQPLAGEKRHYKGYDLYLALCARLVLLLPFWPVLWLGRVLGIGPLVYRLVADRRRRLFGVCEPSGIGPHDFSTEGAAPVTIPVRTHVTVGLSVLFAALFALHFLFVMPYRGVHRGTFEPAWWGGIQRTAWNFGLVYIDVFNANDLRMENNFVTFQTESADGSRVMMPFLDALGQRGWWHLSDRFYFGASLIWRRLMINDVRYCYQAASFERTLLMQPLAQLATALYGPSKRYIFTYWAMPDWNYDRIWSPEAKSFKPSKTCEVAYWPDGRVELLWP